MNSPGHGWSVPEDLPTSRIRRAVPTAGLLIRTAGGRALADFRERAGRAGAIDRFHDRNADRYVDVFGRSKGLLMKVAQMVSMLDVADVGGAALRATQNLDTGNATSAGVICYIKC